MVDDATWALLLLEQADLRAQFIQQVAASVGAPASADTGEGEGAEPAAVGAQAGSPESNGKH